MMTLEIRRRRKRLRMFFRDFPATLSRKANIPFFYLVPSRFLTLCIGKFCLKNPSARDGIEAFGNYYLDSHLLDETSAVYSFGVASEINFDTAVTARFRCKVYLFDPTPDSIEFMARNENQSLIFDPIAAWLYDGQTDMFLYRNSESGFGPGSITNYWTTDEVLRVECQTVKTIMKNLGHKKLDVLKLDIEGAALPVLLDLMKNSIYPRQIVAEFERPLAFTQFPKYWWELLKLFRLLRSRGYDNYKIKNNAGLAIEILSIRKEEVREK